MDVLAPPTAQRIAVIGGGIAGLSMALALHATAQVTLYEAERQLGGHARTVIAGRHGDRPVDTGFIVFNHATYPHFSRLLRELEVPIERSDMSFAASLDGGRIEYGLRDLRALLAQPLNTLSPTFLGMLRDIVRFNRGAEAAVADGQSIGELLAALGLGAGFRRLYMRPLCGAIWSTPELDVDALPATLVVRFMRNHGLLGTTGQHQWWTVRGGSRAYVERLAQRLAAGGVALRTGARVQGVARCDGGVKVAVAGAAPARFDHAVLACHADQALRLLADADATERRLLGAIGYRTNRAVLHADPRQMPRRQVCWSSWTCRSGSLGGGIDVTYWMNRLQNLPPHDPLFVTLNPGRPIPDALVYDQNEFRHPVFDLGALRAQREIRTIQGVRRTWFAGAWQRNGFHEDGIASALRVARAMGLAAW